MALIDIAAGEVGTVVTYLEMAERPKLRPLPSSPLRMKAWPDVTPREYRTLFARIGGRWLWFSRLAMDDAALAGHAGELHVVMDPAGIQVGMVELDFRTPGQCLIMFLGLVPELAGKGHGRWLLAQVLALSWRKETRRVTVNTCTLDHPAALPAYLKAGFTAYKRAFESFPDPRAARLLPGDCAPQVPLIVSALERCR
jgi:GNAT superfamily N-acetyltransferase